MKKIVLIFIFCIISTFIFSETILFIDSTPGRADIMVDGVIISQQTPALLRDLTIGAHNIELSKSGYIADEISVALLENDIKILSQTLEYGSIPLLFPVQDGVQINNKNIQEMLFLENGEYSFDMDPELLQITPIYPWQKIINGLNVSIPIISIFSGALTVNEIYNSHDSPGDLSVFTLSTIGVNAVLIAADILLYFTRDKYYKNYSLPTAAIEIEYPNNLYDIAEDMVMAGKLDSALHYLYKIIEKYPNANIYPNALYKTAKIKIINGDIETAKAFLETIILEYPLPSIYNSAVKSLSDILLRNGQYRESLEQLDLIVFMEAGFSREEIDLQRYKILNKWYETDSSLYVQLKKQLESIVKQYTNSSYYNFYVEILLELNKNYNDSSVQ